MTWLDLSHKWKWLWLDHILTRVNEWLESWQVTQVMTHTHTHTRLSAWIMWSCEPWLCPHLILGEKIQNWYYLVTSVNIKMIHSTPLWVFMYGRWDDDHAVDEIFLSVYKRGIHYTTPYWLELTWRKKWLDLTWLDLKRIAMTWLATRARLTCYNTDDNLQGAI